MFLFFLYVILWGTIHVSRDMSLWSHRNSLIATMRIIYELVVPVFLCFTFSLFGFLLGRPIFHGQRDATVIAGCVIGALATIMGLILHLWTFYIIRGCAILQYDRLFIPWGPKVKTYVILELIAYLLAFSEEFFPLNELWYRVGYSIVVCCLQNVLCTVYIQDVLQSCTMYVTKVISNRRICDSCFGCWLESTTASPDQN